MKMLCLALGLATVAGAWSHELPGLVNVRELTVQGRKVELLVGTNGLTLYTFDVDSPERSNCDGACLAAWPALRLTVAQAATVRAPYGAAIRTDGSLQVSFEGKPLYFYVGDKKPGDMKGDGLGGVWHIALDDE